MSNAFGSTRTASVLAAATGAHGVVTTCGSFSSSNNASVWGLPANVGGNPSLPGGALVKVNVWTPLSLASSAQSTPYLRPQ